MDVIRSHPDVRSISRVGESRDDRVAAALAFDVSLKECNHHHCWNRYEMCAIESIHDKLQISAMSNASFA